MADPIYQAPPPARIHGSSYGEPVGGERVKGQHDGVWAVLLDGQWHTLETIQNEMFVRFGIRATTPSISARIRDFRKEECGLHVAHEAKIKGSSLSTYRLEVNPQAELVIASYHRMNVGGKDSVIHDTQIVVALVAAFAAQLEDIRDRPMHLIVFMAQLRDRVLPLAENHMRALWDHHDADRGRQQPSLAARAVQADSFAFRPEI